MPVSRLNLGGGHWDKLGTQASSEGGDHVTVPARWSDFLSFLFFFFKSGNSGLLHEIFPFLNMAQIHTTLGPQQEICLLVTMGSQPSL